MSIRSDRKTKLAALWVLVAAAACLLHTGMRSGRPGAPQLPVTMATATPAAPPAETTAARNARSRPAQPGQISVPCFLCRIAAR
jgi:hypothetical protein